MYEVEILNVLKMTPEQKSNYVAQMSLILNIDIVNLKWCTFERKQTSYNVRVYTDKWLGAILDKEVLSMFGW